MRTVTLKLPAELDSRLTSLAKRRGITRSALVREALEELVNGRQERRGLSCLDLARDLIGRFTGPIDLSSNEKYLEGFGR